jgi:hypothetical protein
MTTLANSALIASVLALVAGASLRAQEGADITTSLSRMSALAYTEAFPEVDRIELYTLVLDPKHKDAVPEGGSRERFKLGSSGGFGGAKSSDVYVDVDLHVTIDGKKCKEITDAWRSLSFQPNGALCHVPPYGVRFYRENNLLFETTVCWKCHNFYMPEIDPKTGEMNLLLYGFKNDTHAKKLLSIFHKHLPIPKRTKK